jgi:uncharacterized protein (TIGR03083 family)
VTRLDDLQAAYDGQLSALLDRLRALPAGAADEPSRLAGWTVRELAFHTTEVPRTVTAAIAADRPSAAAPLSIADYTARWREARSEIAERERVGAAGVAIGTIIERHEIETTAMRTALQAVTADTIVAARRGPIRVADFLATRVNELVVHSLDLSASLPALDPVEIVGPALAISCRMLAGVLAERVPGHTVEVRVPPYAAVQCVEGPRHTRGTPANVVEVDAVSWVEVATGRLAWAAAVEDGRVRASGERSDISEHLPVLS